jgi:AcrR family transcriptional regulator
VLHAVDDLLVEDGYSAMTMKGIAERAGVGRQTVYRWWSTKAEILFEASVIDGEQELAVTPTGNATHDLMTYLNALLQFLVASPAGAAYRALLGEAQHDPAVARLIASKDVVGDSAQHLLSALAPRREWQPDELQRSAARLVGPAVFWVLSGRDPHALAVDELAAATQSELRARHHG